MYEYQLDNLNINYAIFILIREGRSRWTTSGYQRIGLVTDVIKSGGDCIHASYLLIHYLLHSDAWERALRYR